MANVGWIILFVQDSWWILIVIPAFIEMGVILVSLLRRKSSKKIQVNDDTTINGNGVV